ncbi:diadenosine 5',5'''-P1,P4-tetraphosphate asymmetrical hydrolase [Armillaria borealis]|uniref:Diadenosine 5',5'''-P1,P4-tetraphosphate asymmetrical hydrolase n=1 Tax=Armillaria borealis TaxID=47425 RepID=A0AA39JSI8_9AGAR|nr:diadenosine 5',5'''-P1,P4-tetraphosphate asymmetrical hydrolase [Armillaria borealis]
MDPIPATTTITTSLLFSTIEVTRQAFYRSSLSFAIVNLKPIVPGHELAPPFGYLLALVVHRLTDLNNAELSSLMISVQRVGHVIERIFGGDALTVACQDGKAAGQSVPHVHFHVMPRKTRGDRFSENRDEIYPELERAEGSLASDLKQTQHESQSLRVDAVENRPPRTMEDMEKEANWLKTFFSHRL